MLAAGPVSRPGAPRRRLAAAEVSALQAALAAEQAAVYGYGVVGSHLTGTAGRARPAPTGSPIRWPRTSSRRCCRAGRGGDPAAALAYQLPGAVRTAGQAAALAVTLEDRVTSAYLGLVAHRRPAPLRMLGAQQARAAALRAAAWRGSTVAFPGLAAPP